MADREVPAQRKPNGFATTFMVVYAPQRAFSILAETPAWRPAAIAVISGMIVALTIDAVALIPHVDAQGRFPMPSFLSAATLPVVVFATLLIRLIYIWCAPTLFFLLGALLTRSDARPESAWVVAVNLSVIGTIGALAEAILLYASLPHVTAGGRINYNVLPSLASLGHFSAVMSAFMYSFNPVTLWYWAVAGIALEKTLRFNRDAAIATAVIGFLAYAIATWSLNLRSLLP